MQAGAEKGGQAAEKAALTACRKSGTPYAVRLQNAEAGRARYSESKAVLFGQLAFRLEYERAEDRLLFASFGESRFMLEQFHEDGWNTGRLYRPLRCGANFSKAAEEAEALCRRLQKLDAAVYSGLFTRAAV